MTRRKVSWLQEIVPASSLYIMFTTRSSWAFAAEIKDFLNSGFALDDVQESPAEVVSLVRVCPVVFSSLMDHRPQSMILLS